MTTRTYIYLAAALNLIFAAGNGAYVVTGTATTTNTAVCTLNAGAALVFFLAGLTMDESAE